MITPDEAKDLHVSPVHRVNNGTEPPASRFKEVLQQESSSGKSDGFSLEYKEKGTENTRICFLSGRERNILNGGHSRFDQQFVRESGSLGPGSYHTEDLTSAFHHTLNKVTSKVGYGGLASRAPRFAEQRRESQPTFIRTPFHKKCFIHLPKTGLGKFPKPPPPFGSAVSRNTDAPEEKEDTPGFYYDITRAERLREMPFDHSFGGRTSLRPHVVWKCTPDNLDVCSLCEQKPRGDYYFSRHHFLCRPCYSAEWNRPHNFNRGQLEAFKKIRDCIDIHKHDGTTAAYPLMSDKDIRRLRILECYFASYEGKEYLYFYHNRQSKIITIILYTCLVSITNYSLLDVSFRVLKNIGIKGSTP